MAQFTVVLAFIGAYSMVSAQVPVPLNQAQINRIVKLHNDERASIGSTRMIQVIDNEDPLVQEVALLCNGASIDIDNLPDDVLEKLDKADSLGLRTEYDISRGENIYKGKRGDTLETACAYWKREKAIFNLATGICKYWSICGRYAQIVYWSVISISCAVADCPNNVRYIYCGYSAKPPKNEPVYTPGNGSNAGSDCQRYNEKRLPNGLCESNSGRTYTGPGG